MGVFRVNIEFSKPGKKVKRVKVPRFIVDTGSEATWIQEELLKKAGIEVFKKDVPFVMANGQVITRDVGIALIYCGEFKTVDEVVFARRGDCKLLGARTLEGFNAMVNPSQKKLVAAGPIPATRVNYVDFRLKI